MWEMKKYYLESRSRGISYMKYVNMKANWIGHIVRGNCLLQRVIEGKIPGGIEVTGRQGRRRRKPLDDLKKRRGYSHLKEEALDRTMWRARFGRGFRPVVRQTAKWMNLTHFFLEWDKSCRKYQNTHFVFSNFFFWKSCHLWENVGKYCSAGQATGDNMVHAHCMLDT